VSLSRGGNAAAGLSSPGAATPPQIRRGGFGPPARGGLKEREPSVPSLAVTLPHARRPPSPTLPRKGGEGRAERFPGGAARLCLSPPLEGGPKARSAFGEGLLFEAGKVRVACRRARPSPRAGTPPKSAETDLALPQGEGSSKSGHRGTVHRPELCPGAPLPHASGDRNEQSRPKYCLVPSALRGGD